MCRALVAKKSGCASCRGLERLGGAVDVARPARASEQTRLSVTRSAISRTARVGLRGGREAGLDHVHAQRLELLGDVELLGEVIERPATVRRRAAWCRRRRCGLCPSRRCLQTVRLRYSTGSPRMRELRYSTGWSTWTGSFRADEGCFAGHAVPLNTRARAAAQGQLRVEAPPKGGQAAARRRVRSHGAAPADQATNGPPTVVHARLYACAKALARSDTRPTAPVCKGRCRKRPMRQWWAHASQHGGHACRPSSATAGAAPSASHSSAYPVTCLPGKRRWGGFDRCV